MNKLYLLTAITAFFAVGAISADDTTDKELMKKVTSKMKMDGSEKRSLNCKCEVCKCENCDCSITRCEFCGGQTEDSDEEEPAESRCNCGKPKPKS